MKRSHENAFIYSQNSNLITTNKSENNQNYNSSVLSMECTKDLNETINKDILLDVLSDLEYVILNHWFDPSITVNLLHHVLLKVDHIDDDVINYKVAQRNKAKELRNQSMNKSKFEQTYSIASNASKFNCNRKVLPIELPNEKSEQKVDKLQNSIDASMKNNCNCEKTNNDLESKISKLIKEYMDDYKLKLDKVQNEFSKVNEFNNKLIDQLQDKIAKIEEKLSMEIAAKENGSNKLVIQNDDSRFNECVSNLQLISSELTKNCGKLCDYLSSKTIGNYHYSPIDDLDDSVMIKTTAELQTEMIKLQRLNQTLEDKIRIKDRELESKYEMITKFKKDLENMKTNEVNINDQNSKLLSLEKELAEVNMKLVQKENLVNLAEQEKQLNVHQKQKSEEIEKQLNKLLADKDEKLSEVKAQLYEVTLKLKNKQQNEVTEYMNHFKQLQDKLEMYMAKNQDLSQQMDSMAKSNVEKLAHQKQIDSLIEQKNRLMNSLKNKEYLENQYNTLKSRYLVKRQITNKMEQSYRGIQLYCKNHNIPFELRLNDDSNDYGGGDEN